MQSYHSEPKEYGPFQFVENDITVSYSFIERWVSSGRSETVKCVGPKVVGEIGYSRTSGISAAEFESLKASIGASIGLKGIASIMSNIEANTQSTTTFTESYTISDKFTYEPPGCGRATYFVEQLVRDFQLMIQKPGIIFKPRPISHNFRELTDDYQLRVDRDDQDPQCPCAPTEEEDLGEIIRLKIKKLFALLHTKRDKQNNVTFKIASRVYSVPLDAESNSAEVHLRELPKMFRVLAGLDTADAVAEAVLERDFDLSHLGVSKQVGPVAAAGFA